MGTGLRRSILVLAVMGMMLGVIISPAGADDHETVRPITDWYADPRDPIETSLQANGQNAYYVNVWDGRYWLAGGFAPYGCGMTDDLVKSVEGEIEYQGVIVERLLPDGRAEVTVELEVTHTEPGLQGDRSSAGTKPATLETGAEIQVPLFINTGDKLKVDSRDGSYLGRVN